VESKLEVLRWNASVRDKTPNPPTSKGTLAMGQEEIAALDRLLEVYRTPSPNICTTQQDVTFIQVRNRQIVAAEAYLHHGPHFEEKGNLTFDQLSQAIGPA